MSIGIQDVTEMVDYDKRIINNKNIIVNNVWWLGWLESISQTFILRKQEVQMPTRKQSMIHRLWTFFHDQSSHEYLFHHKGF